MTAEIDTPAAAETGTLREKGDVEVMAVAVVTGEVKGLLDRRLEELGAVKMNSLLLKGSVRRRRL